LCKFLRFLLFKIKRSIFLNSIHEPRNFGTLLHQRSTELTPKSGGGRDGDGAIINWFPFSSNPSEKTPVAKKVSPFKKVKPLNHQHQWQRRAMFVAIIVCPGL